MAAGRPHGDATPPRLLCWSARLVAIAAIGFVSLFALDVFQPGVTLAAALIGLAIHLIPSVVLVGVLAVAWRWPLIGGLLFLAVALAPFVLLSNTPAVNAVLAAPFALAGFLFLVSAFMAQRSA